MRCYALVSALLLTSTFLVAQPKAELGLFLGGSTYLGDLEQEDYFPNTDLIQFSPGIYLGLPIGYRWLLRGHVQYAKIQGEDRLNADRGLRDRDFSFSSTLVEGGIQLLWEPFAKRRFPATGGYKQVVSPYFFAGAGLIIFDANTNYGNPGVDGFPPNVEKDQAQEESPALVLPFGGGVRFDLGQKVSLGLELGLRKAFTDQLDGVSFAGNPDQDDWYVIAGFNLAYRWQTPDYDRDGFLDEVDRCPEVAGLAFAKGCPDSDGDGLADPDDRCPFQVGKIKAEGCPDSDYDGIPDFYDACPGYPGEASAKGCPDRDGDGLADDDDMCPNCPGIEKMSGCPDADGDGIEDKRDRCPQLAGPRSGMGCPYVDSDGDGVFDGDDRCPQTTGIAALKGCPDTDEDGVADLDDRCPELAGVAAAAGCPEVTEDLKATLAAFTDVVQFETGKDNLKSSSKEKLRELVTILNDYPYYHLKISGHTDDRGNDDANLLLSKARAEACQDFLSLEGINDDRMNYYGYGENQPVASNDTAAGRAQNRRVNFELFVPKAATDQ